MLAKSRFKREAVNGLSLAQNKTAPSRHRAAEDAVKSVIKGTDRRQLKLHQTKKGSMKSWRMISFGLAVVVSGLFLVLPTYSGWSSESPIVQHHATLLQVKGPP